MDDFSAAPKMCTTLEKDRQRWAFTPRRNAELLWQCSLMIEEKISMLHFQRKILDNFDRCRSERAKNPSLDPWLSIKRKILKKCRIFIKQIFDVFTPFALLFFLVYTMNRGNKER